MTTTASTDQAAVVRQLSALDRFLPIWILAAMGIGLGLGTLIPRLNHCLSSVQISGTGTSLPIAIGLLVMMYPVLARVRYEELGRLRAERSLFVPSLILNCRNGWACTPRAFTSACGPSRARCSSSLGSRCSPAF